MGEDRLRLLGEMLGLLERYAASVSREDLDRDRETWLKVKGAMELAVQCAIDLAISLVSQNALGVPQTYREAFTLLAEAELIDMKLAHELAAWAGLRNVLVHLYTTLDLDRIHAALKETEPLGRFRSVAAHFLLETDPSSERES